MSDETRAGAPALNEPVVRVTGSVSTDIPQTMRPTQFGTPDASRPTFVLRAHDELGSAAPSFVHRELSIRDVYPALAEVGKTALGDAVRLLEEAARDVDDALGHDEAGDTLSADDAMMRARALLPELFACRTLGDGFAMVVGALIVAFQRHATEPMTRQEMFAIRAALAGLQRGPYMVEEVGANIVDALEDAGLEVMLSGLDRLIEDPGDAESLP